MTDTPDWLTWPQAAELADCPVTTIETYVRSGRIESRGGQGRRHGSLPRSSVEEFATWWRAETTRRERSRAERKERRIRPPEPEGWVQTTEAAELLGFRHSDHVIWLARQGRFEARKISTRWWVRRVDVEAYAADRDKWVSRMTAAEIVGCSHETIRRAVNNGQIAKRDVHRTQASLSLESVRNFRDVYGAQLRSRTRGSPARG